MRPILLAQKVVLLVAFLVLTNHDLGDRVSKFLERGDRLSLTIFAGIWLISIAGIGTAAVLPRLSIRVAWSLPIVLSTVAGHLSYTAAGVQLSFFDIVLYWSERAYWRDMLDLYGEWWSAPVFAGLLGALAIAMPPGLPFRGWRWAAVIPGIPLCIVIALLFVGGGRGTRGLPEQYSSLAMLVAIAAMDPLGDLDSNRKEVALETRRPRMAERIILVVDESVRGDFIDLNVDRDVTPYLLSQRERFANFGYATSGSNCSLPSNLILRFGGVRDRLSQSLRSGPSVWSYAKVAGYETVYIDAQTGPGRLQNGMTLIERDQIDHFLQLSALPGEQDDRHVARMVVELLESESPLFIYINKEGSHFPYAKNYPDSAAFFKPAMGPHEGMEAERERFINAYMNAIRWNTDGFFQELLTADLSRTALIYTSDHGQSLLDQEGFLQCSTSSPHPLEGVVPLLVGLEDPELMDRFKRAAVQNRDAASHFEIFPTLLQLFGFDEADIEARHGAGLLDILPTRQARFSYGPVIGPEGIHIHWQRIPDDVAGLVRQSVPLAGSGTHP